MLFGKCLTESGKKSLLELKIDGYNPDEENDNETQEETPDENNTPEETPSEDNTEENTDEQPVEDAPEPQEDSEIGNQESEDNDDTDIDTSDNDEDYDIDTTDNTENEETAENPAENNEDDENFNIDASDTGEENNEDNNTDNVEDTDIDNEENSDSGGDDTTTKLQQLEDTLFDSLSDAEKNLKKKELKMMFAKLSQTCDDILEKIDKTPNDIEKAPIFSRIQNNLEDIKTYSKYYLEELFDNHTYIENKAYLQKMISILNGVKTVLDNLSSKMTKK